MFTEQKDKFHNVSSAIQNQAHFFADISTLKSILEKTNSLLKIKTTDESTLSSLTALRTVLSQRILCKPKNAVLAKDYGDGEVFV